MNLSFKTLFFLKKGKGYKAGPLPVYLRVTINGKRAECSIQRSCEPTRWNQKKERAIGSNKESVQLNSYLEVIQGTIFEIQKKAVLNKAALTAEQVVANLQNRKEEKCLSLLE